MTINTANTVAGFLIPNKTYYWRVRPYGTYKTFGGFSLANKFTTGSVNAVNEIAGIDNFTILPNPVSSGQSLEINLTSAKSFEGVVKLNTVAGQVVKTEKMRFEAGVNAKFLNINTLSKGIYILTIEAEQGVLNKKVVVSE